MGDLFQFLGVVAAIGVAAWQIKTSLKQVSEQLWLSSFLTFTERFNEILREMPPEVLTVDPLADLEALTGDQKHTVNAAMRRYMNLLSEEYYVFSQRGVDQETWDHWKSYATDFFTASIACQAWQEIRGEYRVLPEFVDEINALL